MTREEFAAMTPERATQTIEYLRALMSTPEHSRDELDESTQDLIDEVHQFILSLQEC